MKSFIFYVKLVVFTNVYALIESLFFLYYTVIILGFVIMVSKGLAAFEIMGPRVFIWVPTIS